jgi:hypothetical protein
MIDEVVKTIEPLAAKNCNQVAVHCDCEIGTMHADQMRSLAGSRQLKVFIFTYTGQKSRHNPAAQQAPDSILANPLCCRAE